MKQTMMALVLVVAALEGGYAQIINWRSVADGRQNMVQITLGYDYGITAQLSYNRVVDLGRPVVFNVDYSFPMGKEVFDDFKIDLGGQVQVAEYEGFSAAVKVASNFRRFENALVSMVSFGSDFGLVTGYYAPSWFAAGEFGFDKSITTRLAHSDIMRSNFPAIRDGWYLPSGGHWYYGMQAGAKVSEKYDISLRLGATEAQFNDENAVLPYYVQVGVETRF